MTTHAELVAAVEDLRTNHSHLTCERCKHLDTLAAILNLADALDAHYINVPQDLQKIVADALRTMGAPQ